MVGPQGGGHYQKLCVCVCVCVNAAEQLNDLTSTFLKGFKQSLLRLSLNTEGNVFNAVLIPSQTSLNNFPFMDHHFFQTSNI